MTNKTVWEDIKDYYKYTFRIQESLVELMADFDVVLLCATGSSNKNIAEFFEIDEKDVGNIIWKRMNFGGWDIDLPINPYNVYTSMVGEFDSAKELKHHFKNHPLILGGLINKESIDLAYYVCKSCRKLEKSLEIGWN